MNELHAAPDVSDVGKISDTPFSIEDFLSAADAGPPGTKPDVLDIASFKGCFPLLYTPSSITESRVLVGHVRRQVAERLGATASAVKLIFEGLLLDRDHLPISHYGCNHHSLVIAVNDGLFGNLHDSEPMVTELANPVSPRYQDLCPGPSELPILTKNVELDSSEDLSDAIQFKDLKLESKTLDGSSLPADQNAIYDERSDLVNSRQSKSISAAAPHGDLSIDAFRDLLRSMVIDNQLRCLFAYHNDLFLFCKNLVKLEGSFGFFNTFVQLLADYYERQCKLTSSGDESFVVAFLGEPRIRWNIARSILNRVVSSLARQPPRNVISANEMSLRKYIATRLAPVTASQNPRPAVSAHLTPTAKSLSDADARSGDDRTYNHSKSVEVCLLQSGAFKNLLIDLQLLLIPEPTRSIAQTLISVPLKDIEVDPHRTSTHLNQCKLLIENTTDTKWNWWPLSQSLPTPQLGYARLQWRCHCNRVEWADVPVFHGLQFVNLFALRGNAVFGQPTCQRIFQPIKRHRFKDTVFLVWRSLTSSQLGKLLVFMFSPLGLLIAFALSPLGLFLVALLWQLVYLAMDVTSSSPSYTKSGSGLSRLQHSPSVSTSTMGSSSSSLGQHSSLQPGDKLSVNTSSTSFSSTSIPIQSHDRFVLLGVKGKRRSPEVIHVDTKVYDDDRKFFSKLRGSYVATRGASRRVLSLWQFSSCEFVKFRKHLPNLVRPMAIDLPLSNEYSYTPRPPRATPETQIEPHIWPILMSTPCSETFLGKRFGICVFSWMHEWFHECIPALKPGTTDLLDRIPKKDSRWLVDTDGTDDAWGIHTRDWLSALHVLIYHVVLLTGPFVFWALWPLLFGNGESDSRADLQNPSVPLLVVIGLLSLSLNVWHAIQPTSKADAGKG